MHIPAAKTLGQQMHDVESLRQQKHAQEQRKIPLPSDDASESEWETYDKQFNSLPIPNMAILSSSNERNEARLSYGLPNVPHRGIMMGARQQSQGFLFAFQDLTGGPQTTRWVRM
ncbi:hypothetical protein [Teredinibacter turnerae]|uniref:hypothetical protein n=1 Tax=Teredinibacter turnerae TaxID=2426 RepID=UPI0003827DFD|nr:hypothetical protein [Teredinibacter turnerae]